jgi:putative ABC transport system ATP-binding protein
MEYIQLEGLKKTYNSVKVPVYALQGVDLTVQKGEFLAIAGPSGSGKTTLLNIIGGLDKPTAGRVVIDGQDITSLDKARLADLRLCSIGFVFQAYNLIPVLTAIENVEFGMLLQGVSASVRRKRSREILAEVGLEGFEKRWPNEMSGGQQQRVAVARAVVTHPRLVLADEPTANLDSGTSGDLLDLMKELNVRFGTTFIFSTHDKMVMERARRIVYLHDGKVAA